MLKNLKEGHRQRIKDKYYKSGIDSLHDYEIIELLLTYCIPRKDCKPFAKELINKFESIGGVFDAKEEYLSEVEGIGKNTLIFLKLIKDINKIITKEKITEKRYINNTLELVKFLKADMVNSEIEYFKVIYLNTNNQFIKEETLFEGTIDKNSIYMRELVKNILKLDAKSVIFAHNHPSGNLKPSKSDIDFTLKSKKILKDLEINLLDHIIVSEDGFYSFLENDIL